MGKLDGQQAFVTGGGSGMGREMCRRMAAEGATVAVVDRNGESAEAVASELGGHAYEVDVADAGAVQQAVDDFAQRAGGLSVLVNNAGVSTFGLTHEADPDEWAHVVAVDLFGPYHGIRAAVPHMQRAGGGSIVSTASISGVRPAAGESAYAAAKAGVIALTASCALEYAPTIRVNCISPGTIRTAMTHPLLHDWRQGADFMLRKTPLARIGEPDDIADVMVFLCSHEARYITGQNLVVDGGVTLHGSGTDGILELVNEMMRGRTS